jgi:hypothetical protein
MRQCEDSHHGEATEARQERKSSLAFLLCSFSIEKNSEFAKRMSEEEQLRQRLEVPHTRSCAHTRVHMAFVEFTHAIQEERAQRVSARQAVTRLQDQLDVMYAEQEKLMAEDIEKKKQYLELEMEVELKKKALHETRKQRLASEALEEELAEEQEKLASFARYTVEVITKRKRELGQQIEQLKSALEQSKLDTIQLELMENHLVLQKEKLQREQAEREQLELEVEQLKKKVELAKLKKQLQQLQQSLQDENEQRLKLEQEVKALESARKKQ